MTPAAPKLVSCGRASAVSANKIIAASFHRRRVWRIEDGRWRRRHPDGATATEGSGWNEWPSATEQILRCAQDDASSRSLRAILHSPSSMLVFSHTTSGAQMKYAANAPA